VKNGESLHHLDLRELGPDDEPAFFKWVDAWKGEDPEWATFTWASGMPHVEHLQKLEDQKHKSKIPVNRVPSTMLYGFVGDQIVGRFSIRHELNEFLLHRGGHVGYAVSPRFRRQGIATEMFRQGMIFCRNLGLARLLITCTNENTPSWLTIEKFGGSLENRIFDTEEGETVRRYWLSVSNALNPKYETKDKAIAYITRNLEGRTQLLVFEHDKKHSEAGTQVPAGTVGPGESVEQALIREVFEESGLANLKLENKIDQYTFFRDTHQCFNRRHVYHLKSLAALPDSWTHQVTGDGIDQKLEFHFYWIDIGHAKGRLAARLDDSIELLSGKKYNG
jgi:predicted acetyltransferase/8-oxo-dGTP pyrophosphatase MutT (NUDIX family)